MNYLCVWLRVHSQLVFFCVFFFFFSDQEVTEKENKVEPSLFSEKDEEPPDSSDTNLFATAIKEHEKDKEKK